VEAAVDFVANHSRNQAQRQLLTPGWLRFRTDSRIPTTLPKGTDEFSSDLRDQERLAMFGAGHVAMAFNSFLLGACGASSTISRRVAALSLLNAVNPPLGEVG
jgi:hypothetical protein